ncbi:predicted protein [Mycobacterium tuberculosis GM 1503]|nr:predicted protein [Mycobacterium tuberculosis GM 1503]
MDPATLGCGAAGAGGRWSYRRASRRCQAWILRRLAAALPALAAGLPALPAGLPPLPAVPALPAPPPLPGPPPLPALPSRLCTPGFGPIGVCIP